MHTNLTADKNWYMPNQQILQYEQRYNQGSNVNVEPINPTVTKQAQFKTLHFQKTQSLQNLTNEYGQPVVQFTHLLKQCSYMNHLNLQNATT